MSKRGLNVTPVVDGNYVYIAHGEDNIDARPSAGSVYRRDRPRRRDADP